MVFISIVLSLLLGWIGSRRLITSVEKANVTDWGNKWLNRLDGLNRIFCHKFHGLQGETLKLPAEGGVLVAANHLSGLDPLLLIASSDRPLRFLIAREQYQRWWLNWLFRAAGCIPVERSRKPQAALLAAREALEDGEVVALFPHGTIHLDHHPPKKLKRGVFWLGQRTGAPIYPVRIDGVRGKGFTVLSVWIPSRARITSYTEIKCEGQEEDFCLNQLQDKITLSV